MMIGLLYRTLPLEYQLNLYPAETQALPHEGEIGSWESLSLYGLCFETQHLQSRPLVCVF